MTWFGYLPTKLNYKIIYIWFQMYKDKIKSDRIDFLKLK